ncbi:sensor histidine kinase [Arthrobacter sp. A5]|uniref:sensor histidine kinase n=1 Tax=Arthrobacter sp. A5 TaxID=576926 RepID=UPI003DA9427B
MFRRRRPVAVVVLAVIETVLLVQDPLSSNASLSLWFGLYAVAVQRGRVFSFITTTAVSLPLLLVFLLLFRLPTRMVSEGTDNLALTGIIAAAVVLLSNVVATGIGLNVRRDREHEMELRAWADRNAQLASVSERNRIAREMHDVVAHSLTVMIALSDGAAVVVKRSPERAGQVLAELSQTGRTALADMRRVLGVLRADGSLTSQSRRPLPAGAGIDGLLDGFRTAGLPLTLTRTGPALPTDPAFQLTVYRILQESRTNVLRYGRSISRVQVEITHWGGQVRLRISDDGRGSTLEVPSVGTGQGIVGMRERANIYAGTVQAGPGPYGGWVVEAVLNT